MVLRAAARRFVFFVVPRLQLGNVAHPAAAAARRAWDDKEKALYHSTSALPSHYYLAAYLWAREQQTAMRWCTSAPTARRNGCPARSAACRCSTPADAGGGRRAGGLPLHRRQHRRGQQAKRRGRAVIVSHQTPPFKPGRPARALTRMHDLLHAWMAQDEGVVKDKIKRRVCWPRAKASASTATWAGRRRACARVPRLCRSAAQPPARAGRNRPAAGPAHLGPCARGAAPPGHRAADAGQARSGRAPLCRRATRCRRGRSADGDYTAGADEALPPAATPCDRRRDALPARCARQLEKARRLVPGPRRRPTSCPRCWQVLAGRHLPTSYGGDPIKNPDAYPPAATSTASTPRACPRPGLGRGQGGSRAADCRAHRA
jgi:cobaltochelatase CobN